MQFIKAKQRGAVLILMAFIIGLAATSYFVKSLATITAANQQEEQTNAMLFEAKKALLGWAESHPNHPGQLPFPDRNDDNNYDGNSNCNLPSSTFSYALLIGQLPVIGQAASCVMRPQSGLGQDFVDAYGNRLWYAVSRNVVHKYENAVTEPLQLVDPIINPNVIDNPVFPWLRVLDANGNVLSNRVAAVIIAPNQVLSAQNRASGVAGAGDYLDSLVLNGVAISNADYSRADEDFMIAPNSNHYQPTPTNPQYAAPYQFNDQLMYITIDELVAATTRRAASEGSRLLNIYRAFNGFFPDAANLGANTDAHNAVLGNESGMLPIDITNTCQCLNQQRCTCGFNLVKSVTLTSEASFSSEAGLCTMVGASCTCTGAGSCASAANTFTCNASGDCTHNIGGNSNRYDYTMHDYLDTPRPSEPSATNACELVPIESANPKPRCYGLASMTGAGSFNIGLNEASWFKRNGWQHYFYYVRSGINAIQAGTQAGISALLIATGKPIVSELGVTQVRPSNDTVHYLDSSQNANGDLAFDARNKQKNAKYNDQLFIFAP